MDEVLALSNMAFPLYHNSKKSYTWITFIIFILHCLINTKLNLCRVYKVKDKTRGATWIPEFVHYQRTIGVDHVHITMLDTFIRDRGFKAHQYGTFVVQ